MSTKRHKYFRVEIAASRHAQLLLQEKTKPELIVRALDLVASEHRRNRLVLAANDELLASGIAIRRVFGVVAEAGRAVGTVKR